MTFTQSVRVCLFRKFVDFSGRASPSEFWWFFLFQAIASIVPFIVPVLGGVFQSGIVMALGMLLIFMSWAVIVPGMAVGARRLQDSNLSGYFQFLWLIPLAGWVAMIILLTRQSSPGPNNYDPAPDAG